MESEAGRAESPMISPEIVGPPPRKIELTGNGITLAIVTAVSIAIAAIFTCFIAAEALQQVQIRSDLPSGGNETLGKIERLHQPYPLKEYVDYTFIADDKTYTGKAIVPLDVYHTIKSASSLSIRYLPDNPAVNHPVDWEWSIISEWDPFFTISLVAGLGCLLFLLPQLLFERKLAAEGAATIGVVKKCSVSGRGGQFVNLRYDFRTHDDIEVQGSGSFQTRQEIGAKLMVFYLPQKPSKNLPYPLSSWRIANR